MYLKCANGRELLIRLLLNKRKNKLYNDLVKQVKPKWYENKWIWFGLGVVATAGSVKLAGEIVD